MMKFGSIALVALALMGCGDDLPEDSPFAFTPTSREDHIEFFPIEAGVHAGSDCNDCHGGFDSFTEFTCIQACHDGTGHPEDVTAVRHDGIPGYVWETSLCFACHPEGS